jgi:hypothetical protein
MQAACEHCGQQHVLDDEVTAKHARVQFRCTRCGLMTQVDSPRRADQTQVISPMPSFARSESQLGELELPPEDAGLKLPATMIVVLTVLSGPSTGTEFTLIKTRTVIGRKGTDFPLNDPEISRHHCLLEARETNISLKDLGSTNGTFFEDERVRAAFLQDGAEFRVGSSRIRVNFVNK